MMLNVYIVQLCIVSMVLGVCHQSAFSSKTFPKIICIRSTTLNPFHVTDLYIYHLKTKTGGFLCFQGGIERDQWHEMVTPLSKITKFYKKNKRHCKKIRVQTFTRCLAISHKT